MSGRPEKSYQAKIHGRTFETRLSGISGACFRRQKYFQASHSELSKTSWSSCSSAPSTPRPRLDRESSRRWRRMLDHATRVRAFIRLPVALLAPGTGRAVPLADATASNCTWPAETHLAAHRSLVLAATNRAADSGTPKRNVSPDDAGSSVQLLMYVVPLNCLRTSVHHDRRTEVYYKFAIWQAEYEWTAFPRTLGRNEAVDCSVVLAVDDHSRRGNVCPHLSQEFGGGGSPLTWRASLAKL